MELDELKIAWSELGRRVEQQDLQVAELRRHNAVHGLRARLRLVTAGQVVQVLIGLLLAVWGGGTWVDHLGSWHLFACGLALHLYGIALIASATLLLTRVAAIDYARPVADIQHAILRLRRARIRTERILLAIGGVIWVPIMLLLLHEVGFDAWLASPANVLANLGAGLLISIVLLWVFARYPAWFERTAQGRHFAALEQDLADLS